MTVQFETPAPTEGILRIALNEQDLQPRVEKKLKQVATRVAIKGFRPGKVPAQLVKKMYGEEVLLQEMNDLLNDTINGYFDENKDIQLLGNPLPMSTEEQVDLKRPETYKFAFKCGIVPPFEYNLEQIYIKDYEVIVDDAMVEKTIHSMQHEHGKFGPADFVSPEDVIKGVLYDTMHDYSIEENRPFDTFEAGETLEETKFYMETYLPIEQVRTEMQQHFLNATVGTIIHFDINELMSDTEKGLKNLTGLGVEELQKLQGDFAFEIKEILHTHHAELNEEFFKKVFPDQEITTPEAFKEAVKEDTTKFFASYNKTLQRWQIQKQLLENTNVELPNEFLKEFLIQKDKKNTPEKIEEEFPKIQESVRWEMLAVKLNQEFEFKVTTDEINREAVNSLLNMYGNYGNSPEIYNFILQMAGDFAKKNANTLAQNVLTNKLLEAVAEKLTPAKQIVSEDEFWAVYNER
jgi:trigger factor